MAEATPDRPGHTGKTATSNDDPTKNVLDLVAAGVIRQDDLRDAQDKWIKDRVKCGDELSEERYHHILRELDAIESRRKEHKEDTNTSVDKALASAKEAVREQASSAEKAIQKSETTVNGQIKAVEGIVDDLKARIVTLETQKLTTGENRGDSRDNIKTTMVMVGGLISLLLLIIAFANFIGPIRS